MLKYLPATMGLMLSCTALAQQHPACRDIDYAYQNLSANALRYIAGSCSESTIAGLYYRRAQHTELMDAHTFMSQLDRVSKERDDWTVHQDQVFLSLVEIFTAQRNLPDIKRAEVINVALDHSIEIAELRLKGYEQQARKLELQGVQLPEETSGAVESAAEAAQE